MYLLRLHNYICTRRTYIYLLAIAYQAFVVKYSVNKDWKPLIKIYS